MAPRIHVAEIDHGLRLAPVRSGLQELSGGSEIAPVVGINAADEVGGRARLLQFRMERNGSSEYPEQHDDQKAHLALC
jgi:hypothetical protein